MEKQIKESLGKQEISKVKELIVADCKSTNVIGLSEEFKSLEYLEINSVGLTTLKSFPRLVNLKELHLTNNLLSEDFDALASLPKLTTIDLSGNKIKDVDALHPLTEIASLVNINLKGCDITEIDCYRRKIFDLFPGLQCLDGVKKLTDEDDDVDDEEDDLDDESLGEEEEDDEEGEAVPLSAIYNNTYDEQDDEDEEEDKDFEGEDIDEEEDLDEEEGDEDVAVANLSVEKVDGKTRGKKRKANEEVGGEKESKK